MKIIEYQACYKKQVEHIAMMTSSKAMVDPIHAKFTLAMYADPYLDHGIAYLIEDQGSIYGYILCASNYLSFMSHKEEILSKMPPAYHKRALKEWTIYAKYQDHYPAHLHIDLLKETRGMHLGTQLMQTLIQKLKEEHVEGLMLGVSLENKAAIAFYTKNGFHILEQDEVSVVMGLCLK